MRIRVGWLATTALAYGIAGGWLLYAHLWDVNGGLAWTPAATARVLWAVFVLLGSTLWLARLHPPRGDRWMALHASAAFLLGAAAAWGIAEFLMRGSWQPRDADIREGMRYCMDCAQRAPILRQALLAALAGTIAAAVLAPRVARAVNHIRPRTGTVKTGA